MGVDASRYVLSGYLNLCIATRSDTRNHGLNGGDMVLDTRPRSGAEDHNGKLPPGHRLLIPQILVGSDEEVIACPSAVARRCPLDRSDHPCS